MGTSSYVAELTLLPLSLRGLQKCSIFVQCSRYFSHNINLITRKQCVYTFKNRNANLKHIVTSFREGVVWLPFVSDRVT